jgi:hypothetical protein
VRLCKALQTSGFSFLYCFYSVFLLPISLPKAAVRTLSQAQANISCQRLSRMHFWRFEAAKVQQKFGAATWIGKNF